jgi:hypothetical protein
MRVPEEPVCIDLFRQNQVFTSLHLNYPFHVIPPLLHTGSKSLSLVLHNVCTLQYSIYLHVNCAGVHIIELFISMSICNMVEGNIHSFIFYSILFYSKLYTTGLGEVLLKWLSLGTGL